MSKKKKRKHPAPGASKYITISVAEYVCLVKAATMLEALHKIPTYYTEAHAAIRQAVADMFPDSKGGGQA